MLRLLHIEWLKVRTYKTFWLLFLGFIISYPATFYLMAQKITEATKNDPKAKFLKGMITDPFTFPGVWLSSAYFGGLFFLLLGMLFILLVTNEVQYRTHRQNIIDGWSRTDYLLAKLQVMVVFVLIASVLVFVAGYVVGKTYSPATADYKNQIYFVAYFVLMATVYMMVAFLMAITVKRTGLAIILYFALVTIVDNFAWLILTMKNSQAGYYLPLECTDSLVPNPFKPKLLEQRKVADSNLIYTALGYIAVFSAIITIYFKRVDLKN